MSTQLEVQQLEEELVYILTFSTRRTLGVAYNHFPQNKTPCEVGGLRGV